MNAATTSRPVLVGVDGSNESRSAVAAGIEEAHLRRAPLQLLTITTWPVRDVFLSSGQAEFVALVRGGAEDLLSDLAGQAAESLRPIACIGRWTMATP